MDLPMVTRRRSLFVLAGALIAAGATLWMLRPPGYAFTDLWLTADQQGRWRFGRGDYAGAAQAFRDPMWQGVACLRARDIDCATRSFARIGTADGGRSIEKYTKRGHRRSKEKGGGAGVVYATGWIADA